ncbi:MAG: DUF2865 domain-containing protein [Xanthobacteraceae bacterium]|nr:DUF2865 domain-containing protein [Xanthobacteraceae bacterium]
MRVPTCRTVSAAAAFILTLSCLPVANAGPRDFFSTIFGNSEPAPATSTTKSGSSDAMNYSNPLSDLFGLTPPKRVYISRSDSFCVRTCDGRYFPVVARDGQSTADACHSFCPASETKIFRGSSIDNASNEQGKLYSAVPNAFRYRNELVPGCTCGGSGPGGLASVRIEDDPTLRTGDIVASADGLMVVSDRGRNGSLKLKPASNSVRAQYRRRPAVAVR